ncbi:MAG: GNAT family N-acetyltransferase [Candidatus Thorarchaeota archaeon]
MQIQDLSDANVWDLASFCLRDCQKEAWYCRGDEQRIQTAWKRKEKYLQKMLRAGVRAKIAYSRQTPLGFIEYYPIETTNLELVGENIMAIWCINVAQSVRGQGIGSQLLKACLGDVKKLGRKGVAVTCWDPLWMPKGFFKKHGFREVGKAVGAGLVFFHAEKAVAPPKWIGRGATYEIIPLVEDKAVLDIFHSDRCPIHWRNTALIKEIASEFHKHLLIREYDMDEREAVLKHRIQYSVFLDGKVIAAGPQVKAESIRQKITAAINAHQQ